MQRKKQLLWTSNAIPFYPLWLKVRPVINVGLSDVLYAFCTSRHVFRSIEFWIFAIVLHLHIILTHMWHRDFVDMVHGMWKEDSHMVRCGTSLLFSTDMTIIAGLFCPLLLGMLYFALRIPNSPNGGSPPPVNKRTSLRPYAGLLLIWTAWLIVFNAMSLASVLDGEETGWKLTLLSALALLSGWSAFVIPVNSFYRLHSLSARLGLSLFILLNVALVALYILEPLLAKVALVTNAEVNCLPLYWHLSEITFTYVAFLAMIGGLDLLGAKLPTTWLKEIKTKPVV